jgi:hypothetical protein
MTLTSTHRAVARHIGADIERDMMGHPDAVVGAALAVESAQAVERVVEEVRDR